MTQQNHTPILGGDNAQTSQSQAAASEPPSPCPQSPIGTTGEPLRLAPIDPLGNVLTDILHQVNDWLKFAEAKNAGILGLASAGVLALLATMPSRTSDVWEVRVSLVASAFLLALSLFASLISFLPRTNLPAMIEHPTVPPAEADNLLFYGHLARYAPGDLVQALSHRYCETEIIEVGRFHLDLAMQISTNAQITIEKLRLFSYAVVLFGLAVVFVLLAMISAAFV